LDVLTVETAARTQFVDVTDKIAAALKSNGLHSGAVVAFVPHTTAGITINEDADPSVRRDLDTVLTRLVPAGAGYQHLEGNADAHVKASLMGSSVTVLVEDGALQLGTWQGIYFAEFDGPRRRRLWLGFLPGD
jgi:secondary thiamine-phosphate synthase enzyme